MARLLITEIFPPRNGGSGRWFYEIYRRMPRDQHMIVAGRTPGDTTFDANHDLNLHRIPLSLPDFGFFQWNGCRHYLQLTRQVASLIRTHHVREIHCGRCLPEGWIAYMLRFWFGIPYLCYVHGEEVNQQMSNGFGGMMSSRQLRWMTARVLGSASKVIANSRNTTTLLRQQWHVPSHRLFTMTPGVDTRYFVPAAPDPERRHRLGWHDRSVVLTVGRLQKRKGHDMMLRALPLIRRAVPNVLYAVVGDGEEKTNLRELSRSLDIEGQVQFLGEVDDATLLSCYQQCDLFVLPNRQVGSDIEGFGMVLVEAQACGKPVLAGNSGGTAETLLPGETGAVVDCTDPQTLASAVIRHLDPAVVAGMATKARQWVVNTYDWEALAVRARQIFDAPPGKTP